MNQSHTQPAGFVYQGSELELFAEARNWKRYFGSQLAPYLTGSVLEVGAGMGETARILCDGRQTAWLSLEPDPNLAAQMERDFKARPLPVPHRVCAGTVDDFEPAAAFDTVLYIDVLEHIENDAGELRRAAGRLHPGGRLIVLGPAHQWLYSPFDRAIGHHRRYNVTSLRNLRPDGVIEERMLYLDSAGMLASLANRLLLRQSQPDLRQIRFWDRVLVPVSRLLDRILLYRAGKSVVAVFRRPV